MRDQIFTNAINNYFHSINNEAFAQYVSCQFKSGFAGPVLVFSRNRHHIVIGYHELTGDLTIDDQFMLKPVVVPDFVHVTNWLNQAVGKF